MFDRVFERLAGTDLLLVVALATLVVPAIFLAVLAFAAFRRLGGRPTSPRLEKLVVFTGGLTVGTFLLFGSDLLLAVPFLVVLAGLTMRLWRARQRVHAGWLLLGAGNPIVAVWGRILASPPPSPGLPGEDFATAAVWAAVGLVATLTGAWLIFRGDPPPPEPRIDAPAGQPGSRDIGSIAEAIRGPSAIGPFGLPEVSMLVAMVAVGMVVSFLVGSLPVLLRIGIVSAAVAVVGTEAYVRSLTTRSRRAFEAFSWLGEWEVARARALAGGVPTSRDEAIDWLVAHPRDKRPSTDDTPIRIEIELLAGRRDEARALVDELPTATPWERFEQAALRDLVDWRSGGDGDLAAMESLAGEIQPTDGDDRLRADVTIAVAKVRRLMADGRAGAGDAAAPLIDVRERLGSRADGQVGRALRRRVIPQLLIVGVVLTTAFEALAGSFG